MVMVPSSIGWRRTSVAVRGNSGSSSRKSTPWWARLSSPGRGTLPPPERPAGEMEWCGERNGRDFMREMSEPSMPAMEYIFVVSRLSSNVMSGSIDGMRFASILFPEPGGPIIRVLCPPAAAISSARLTGY